MTPSQAREILDNVKYGIKSYPQATINEALIALGDLTPALDSAPAHHA